MHRLTSLLLVEERLLEVEYFVRRLRGQRDPLKVGYELNAFLSAARSVTFLLQKELAHVPGFEVWWAEQRALLANDRAARFFLELRNFSQKQGRVSLVSTAIGSGRRRRWRHCFAGTVDRVPAELLHRDAVDCCRQHLRKLARIVLACTDRFPFHTCPRHALTLEGLEALGIRVEDVEEMLGYPRGWTRVAPGTLSEQLQVLGRQVDGLNFSELHRLARLRVRREKLDAGSELDNSLLHSLVDHLESSRENGGTVPIRTAVAKHLLKRRQPPD